MSEKKHIPVPKETPAFFCANCGAVALDQNEDSPPQPEVGASKRDSGVSLGKKILF